VGFVGAGGGWAGSIAVPAGCSISAVHPSTFAVVVIPGRLAVPGAVSRSLHLGVRGDVQGVARLPRDGFVVAMNQFLSRPPGVQ
jgi:hypothetical protein